MQIASRATPEGLAGHMWLAGHGLSTTDLDTSLYFIIINLHTKLKPQVNARYDMKSPAFTMLYAHRLVTEAPPYKIFCPPLEKCVEHILNYWTWFKTFVLLSENSSPPWCLKLVMGLYTQ